MDFLDISVELFIVFIIVCIILCLHGIGINSTFGNQLQVSANLFISPLPVKPGGGALGFLAVCHSVRLSVRPSVRLGVRPLGFPNFSHLSFDILTWNLECEFVLT